MPPKYIAWVWIVVTKDPQALRVSRDGLLWRSSSSTSFSTYASARRALRKTVRKMVWANRAKLRIIRVAITDQPQLAGAAQ